MRLLLALLMCGVFASSQPPIPTPPEPAQVQKDKARPIDTKAEPDSRPPLTQSPTGDDKSTQGQQAERESPTDWWAVANTGLITVFTGVLCWVAVRQWLAMERQSEYMRDGLAETRKANEIASINADAARENIKIVVSKERARLKVKPWDVSLGNNEALFTEGYVGISGSEQESEGTPFGGDSGDRAVG